MFNAPVLNAVSVTLTGTSAKKPLASVTRSVKVLIVTPAGVPEKTTLKLPLNVSGIWPATLGAVNVTGPAPLAVQVSIELPADTLTKEYVSPAAIHPAGMPIATLLTAKHPLLVTENVSSVFVLPALVVVGETVGKKVPRVVGGVDVEGSGLRVDIATPLRVPDAEPLKVNGLVAPVALS